MKSVDELFEAIAAEVPIVDNPAGLMHNYMARKPYNIVSLVIRSLSPEDGFVYDPMAGSGTTIIEAAKTGRYGLGADVNPIANLIATTTLTKWDLDRIYALISGYMQDLDSVHRRVYGISVDGGAAVIERCHFHWDGCVLEPIDYWYKSVDSQGNYSSRKRASADKSFCHEYAAFANVTIKRIKNSPLIPNSRIALPEGRSVHDYFCNRNLVFLDSAKQLLEFRSQEYGFEVLKLLFSSAINLIKISDKKASSQIPFWIPKKNVTSRNGYFVFKKKAKAILEGLEYCNNALLSHYDPAFPTDSINGPSVGFYLGGSQEIPDEYLPAASVDLVVTDPPYTDQIPYVEYSQLTAAVMDISIEESLQNELVVSDAPSRDKTGVDFNRVFEQIMKRTHFALKDGGYLAMFYHSLDLRSWDSILSLMKKSGYIYVDQMPTASARKSFKTILSPGKNLDGNYLIVFRKEAGASDQEALAFTGNFEEAERLAFLKVKEIAVENEGPTLQAVYDQGLLKDPIEKGYLHILAANYRTFAPIVDAALREGKECTGC